MRSGNLPALLAHLRIVVRTSALALAALLVAGAAPAGAMSTFFAQNIEPDPTPAYASPAAAEAAFIGMLGGASDTEDFEGFMDGDHGPLNLFQGGAVTGVLSDSVDDGGTVRMAVLDDAGNRGFPISTDHFWKNETTSDMTNELFRVTFSEEVLSFGFYATAWSTQSTVGATALVLELIPDGGGGSTFISIDHNQAGDLEGSIFYFGVIADAPFIAAALRNSTEINPGDRIGFDDFTVAIVPEPSTGLLLSAGLLGLAAIGRRRVRLA
ncbi:MAG: PEP-CTERM sorting domain-containing protein [Myxococcales bacterium]|nr:MAG: PEP-CTERM sorting domain-containing protein [Myxococcales bacterium]